MMRCCINCFKDIEIRAVIESHKQIGTCDFCNSTNTYVYDFAIDNTIAEKLEGLLDIYTTEMGLPASYPKTHLADIFEILIENWNIFDLDKATLKKLIILICKEKNSLQPEFFTSRVGISELCDRDYLDNYSIIKTYKWENFVEAIKLHNRFHTDYLNREVFDTFLPYIKKDYCAGSVFYRARVSKSKRGLKKTEMGAPLPDKATAGRANSEGISCLYLANSQETTLHEIRAGVYDYVTVGRFVATGNFSVINLADINKISPFAFEDLTQYAINMEHLKHIGEEIARPLRRHDSPLDYLPTQYICDYIKSKGYDGIEYISTMCNDGYNLALFDKGLFKCTKTYTYEITSLKYGHDVIK